MDFIKLHEPYESEESPSPDAQLTWLQKFVPQDIAGRAMLQVYTQIEQGLKFEETTQGTNHYSAGWNFCQYLKAVALDLQAKAATAYLDVLARQDAVQKEKIREAMLKKTPKGFWSRLKAVFSDPYKGIS